MLIIRETVALGSALESLQRAGRLRAAPRAINPVYRPFWLGKATYRAEDGAHQPVAGTLVFLADARVPCWNVVGAYRHQAIANVLDLRAHQVDFLACEGEPEDGARVLEPLLTQAELSTSSRLLSARRLLARTLKLGRVRFDDAVEYHLVYRPYWEIEFETRRGGSDVALVSRDNLLVRKR